MPRKGQSHGEAEGLRAKDGKMNLSFLTPSDLFQGVDLIIPGIVHMHKMFLGNPSWLWGKKTTRARPIRSHLTHPSPYGQESRLSQKTPPCFFSSEALTFSIMENWGTEGGKPVPKS